MEGTMPGKGFDPMDGLTAEDHAYLDAQKRAKARQEAAWQGHPTGDADDEERRRMAEEHRRKTMADHGVSPADLLKDQPQGPAAASSVPESGVAPSPAAGVPTLFSVLKAGPVVTEVELPQAHEQFAPDWAEMKKRISPHDGTWLVEKFEFHPHVAHILGFFGKEGWEAPEDAKKEEFEVIVKGGRVFRTDPE
jgi:hypothetical protein